MASRCYDYARWLVMPGGDLFTRRRVLLQRHWRRGPRRVLDAGSGNGWFSYLAARSGATVIAVNMDEGQVKKAQRFYNHTLGITPERLEFRVLNLYDVEAIHGAFDEIICYETLEHIKRDHEVCRSFFRKLKPGGVLHLCCPNAAHPRWRNEPLDEEESGYHVRAGYTLESYRELLEPIGFSIVETEGLGGTLLVRSQDVVQAVQRRLGNVIALATALVLAPSIRLDRSEPAVPFSMYVKAIKSDNGDQRARLN